MRTGQQRAAPVTSNNIVKASELEELRNYNVAMNEKMRQRDQQKEDTVASALEHIPPQPEQPAQVYSSVPVN